MLFASQAAAAIVNARTHRDERRARADLEALVETSPVGVLVFDAEAGRPVSVNREARRIAESLRTPGHPHEQLLEVMTLPPRRRQRGAPEASFRSRSCCAAARRCAPRRWCSRCPTGAASRVLVNVTPIRTEGDAIGSVVVTVQDLAPLDEIERLRTEFLGLVSHELREPLAAIKGSAATLLEEQRRSTRPRCASSTASSSSRPTTCAA